jgi:hypothetical protein
MGFLLLLRSSLCEPDASLPLQPWMAIAAAPFSGLRSSS